MVLTDNLLDSIGASVQDGVKSNLTDGAIGTGGNGEDSSANQLGNEILRVDRQETSTGANSGVQTVTVSTFINSTQANGNNIDELGLFDADSDGEMQAIETFQEISKNNDIELFFDLTVSIEVSQSNA